MSKSRLNDSVKNLDADDTNEIVIAYEDDNNELQNSKNKDGGLIVDQKPSEKNRSDKVIKEMDKLDEKLTEKYDLDREISELSPSSSAESNLEDKCESKNGGFRKKPNGEIKYLKNGEADTKNVPEEFITDTNVEAVLNVTPASVEHDTNEAKHYKQKSSIHKNSEFVDLVSETISGADEKLPQNSFLSIGDSFMDITMDTNIESTSEDRDFESDDVKSIASEIGNSKESEKAVSKSGLKKNIDEADEIDCAPTRVRMKMAIPSVTKDCNAPSIYSGTSAIVKLFRSKVLNPISQPSKGILYNTMHVAAEPEETNRRTRAKSLDIVRKGDREMAEKFSSRNPERAATTELGSPSKNEKK